MKRALLFFDEIYFIFPSDKKYKELVNESKRAQIDLNSLSNFPTTPISEFEILFENRIFKKISPASIVSKYGDYMVKAFEEDELDQEFRKLGHDKREIPWNLFTEKIPFPILRNRNFSQYLDGSRVSIPMIQGESIMISHTISSCDYLENLKGQKICPISDEEFHRKMMRYRLKRGVSNYIAKTGNELPPIRRAYDVMFYPPRLNLQKVLKLRIEESKGFKSLQKCIRRLAELMQSESDDYPSEFAKIYDEIKSIYKEFNLADDEVPNESLSYSPNKHASSSVIGVHGEGAIGINLVQNTHLGLITSTNTGLSERILSEKSKLSAPTITFDVTQDRYHYFQGGFHSHESEKKPFSRVFNSLKKRFRLM